MRRLSKKRASALKRISDDRKAFLAEFPRCMICGTKQSRDVHEIARGASRGKAEQFRQTWLALCGWCHDAVDDYEQWPITRQLAVKRRCDPAWYDRVFVNRLRNRADDAITEDEVIE
jgi:hypothetical protein